MKKVNKKGHRVMVIGDLHCPFDLDAYFAFVKKKYKEWKCDTVVFIGDIIDNHYPSYHQTDPDGFGAGEELDRAISRLKRWYKEFPKAYVTIGNHDRMILRKAYSSGVPERWIKPIDDVLEVPGWEFVESITVDDVLYVHGDGAKAKTRMKNDMVSVVQGHIHTEMYVDWHSGANNQKLFAMQVGCGIDREKYAFAYAKYFKKQQIGCGVVIDGEVAVNLAM